MDETCLTGRVFKGVSNYLKFRSKIKGKNKETNSLSYFYILFKFTEIGIRKHKSYKNVGLRGMFRSSYPPEILIR